MKKVIIKVVVLLLVFVGALGIFSLTMNRGNKDLTITMAQATLPIMHFYNGTIQINELHGYVKEMDAVGMREDITPVGENRLLRMSIDTYGKKIDNIRYEVRSMDAKRLIAEADVEDYDPDFYSECGCNYVHYDKNGAIIDDDCPEDLIVSPREY